jgi:hypothetical protein
VKAGKISLQTPLQATPFYPLLLPFSKKLSSLPFAKRRAESLNPSKNLRCCACTYLYPNPAGRRRRLKNSAKKITKKGMPIPLVD